VALLIVLLNALMLRIRPDTDNRVSTTPGSPGNLLEFKNPPGNPGNLL